MLSVKLALDWLKLPGGQQIPNQHMKKIDEIEEAGGTAKERHWGEMVG